MPMPIVDTTTTTTSRRMARTTRRRRRRWRASSKRTCVACRSICDGASRTSINSASSSPMSQASRQGLDHLDEVLAPVALATCEFDELSDPFKYRTLLRSSRHCDSATSAELEETLVPQYMH